MQHQSSSRVGLGLCLLAAATSSTSGTLAKSLIDAGWSPAAAVTARFSIAALVLAVPAAAAMRGRWHLIRRDAGMIALYGLIAVAGCQLFFFNAVQHLSVGVALMLEYLGTIGVVGWMWARHRQRPRRLTLCGAAAALAGLALILGVFGHSHLDFIGVLWGLAAAVGLATFFVLSSSSRDDLPPAALATGGFAVAAVALLALGGVRALPMHATFGQVTFAGHHVSWLVPVACVSLVAGAIAYAAGVNAARILGPRLSSFTGLTEVIFAVLIAWALLGQLPTGIQLAGGALIVAGIVLVRIDELRPPKAPPAGQPSAGPALAGREAD
jgi:drug/metabolite transporter (DMT)-like permease